MDSCVQLVVNSKGRSDESQALMEETLDSLMVRLKTLDSVVVQRCDDMRTRLQELTAYQVTFHDSSNSMFECYG